MTSGGDILNVTSTRHLRAVKGPCQALALGVVAAREGDLDTALAYGERALAGERKSLPSLAMVASGLGRPLQTHYGSSSDAQVFVAHLRELQGGQ